MTEGTQAGPEKPGPSDEEKERERQQKIKAAFARLEFEMQQARVSKQSKQWLRTAARACMVGAALFFFVLMAMISRVLSSVQGAVDDAAAGGKAAAPDLQGPLILVGVLFTLCMMGSFIFSAAYKASK